MLENSVHGIRCFACKNTKYFIEIFETCSHGAYSIIHIRPAVKRLVCGEVIGIVLDNFDDTTRYGCLVFRKSECQHVPWVEKPPMASLISTLILKFGADGVEYFCSK